MKGISMFTDAPKELDWRVSSTCESGACIKVASRRGSVFIGSTSKPEAPLIECTGEEFREFVAGVKLGNFDDIA
jgi:Domain of unknown function (DUF397)